MIDPGSWNWLEIAKLAANLLIPLTLAAFGIFVHRVTKRFEHLQWRSQKLVEKRLAVYDDLASLLNDVLCYFTYVGNWRDLNPPDVVALQRKIDKKIYLAAPLFTTPFFEACISFQSLCFETYSGWGRDARLRTQFERRKQSRPDWNAEWDDAFSQSHTEPQSIREAYDVIMTVMARDIGVNETFVIPSSGRPPENRR